MLETVDYRNHPVLYVDHEESSLGLFRLGFAEEFTILTAESGESALRILEETRVAVVLTDQQMPGMCGTSFLEIVKERYPYIVRLMVSAHADRDGLIEAINRCSVARFLQKPWRWDEMRGAVRAAIELYHLEGLVSDLRMQGLRSEKLSSLGFATAGIAHDMKTPLTSLSSGMELFERHLAKLRSGQAPAEVVLGDLQQVLGLCRQSVGKLRSLVETIRTHVKEHPAASSRVDLSQVVESTLRLCRSEVLSRAQLEVQRRSSPQVIGNPSQLGQVFLNLLNNAALSIAPGAMEKNRILVEIDEEESRAVVRVSDTGEGIPESVQQKVFEPFYSTRSDGTGLGLAIVREIVTQHGGELRLESRLGVGSVFTVLLPNAP